MLPPPEQISWDVTRALAEDVGTGDITAALLPQDLSAQARIISREPMMVCGQAWVEKTFAVIDPSVQIIWAVREGEWCSEPLELCQIKGNVRAILTAERTALNFLQTLSGTATITRQYAEVLKNYKTRLLDTRKTLPGLRFAQKYAVVCGGGLNHRMGLYDAFLIKENHIKACGGIREAVLRAKAMQDAEKKLIEIEVETLGDLQQALLAKPDRVLLDNFTHQMMIEAVQINQPKQCELEVSGGVTLASLASVAETGVDYVSIGAITKSVRAIDLSLLLI